MIAIFLKALFTKGYWKFSGRTNKTISNRECMIVAFALLLGSFVTLLTLGNITFWGDIPIALSASSKDRADMFDRAVKDAANDQLRRMV